MNNLQEDFLLTRSVSKLLFIFTYTCFIILCGLIIFFDFTLINLCVTNFIIVATYFLFKPNNILHPNNIVFAFNFLYVVLPSSIQLIYQYFELPYILPWGMSTNWMEYTVATYFHINLIFLIFYFGFYFFCKKTYRRNYLYCFSKFNIYILIVTTISLLSFYLYFTGGIFAWISSYKSTFLLGRSGLGLFNFIVLFIVDMCVFVLGLFFHRSRGWRKALVLIGSIFLIVFSSFLQGLKSRFIILLVIFLSSYLINMKVKSSRVIILGTSFFVILFVGNYIRSDGFYSSFLYQLEYLMTYFNVYELHNMIISQVDPGLFKTIHHVFVKPLQLFGIAGSDADFDLSVMLTKEYFPKSWEVMKATQQWPLATELYYNYYGFVFGWIPVLVYAFVVSRLYRSMIAGNVAIGLIYILEFFRLFSVQRGVLLPWQLPVYIFFYLIIYCFFKISVQSVPRPGEIR